MNEGDSMDKVLKKIKDLKEQLITADEILPDSFLMQIVLNGLLDLYLCFASTLRLMMRDGVVERKNKSLMEMA